MVRLINRKTGGDMWVAEDRVEEYLAVGHKLPAKPQPKPTVKKTPKKRSQKK